MIRKTSKILSNLEYFVKGNNPKLLIHCGTYGDEYDVVKHVENAVIKYEEQLPDFVFVPIVSPSAVKLRTRINDNGKDLNRIFFSDSTDPEVLANIEIIGENKYDLFVSFHEDFEFPDYYIYDEGFTNLKQNMILNHNSQISKLGFTLFNGIDDPILNNVFLNGYKKIVINKDTRNNGMITSWMLSEGKVLDTLNPEIPMNLDSNSKKKIIDTFFENVLCYS